MRTRSSRAVVGRFLREYKALLGTGENHGFDLWLTGKNRRFLDAGFTKTDVGLIIRSLRVADYAWGPAPDDRNNRPPGDVWLFRAEFEGLELYVKLKIERSHGRAEPAICMSCHEAEFPIETPYRRKRHGHRTTG